MPLSFVAALNRHGRPTRIIRGAFQIGLSMPVFYVGLVLLTVFAAKLRWFPVGGYGDSFLDNLYHLFLPAHDAGAQPRGRADAQSARGDHRGRRRRICRLRPRQGAARRACILVRHVLRNALISTVTLFGLSIGTLLGGAVITETVFAIPGAGRLMIDSIYGRDYPVIQGLTIALAVLVSLTFLVTDIVQAWLDPRVGAMSAIALDVPRRRSSYGGRRAARYTARRDRPARREPDPGIRSAASFAPYDPTRLRLQRDPEGAEFGASFRHRQFRPRRAFAGHLTPTASTCRSPCSRPSGPFIFGTLVGALVGYVRRTGRRRCSAASSMR